MAAHVEAAPGGSSAVLAEPPRSLLETVAEVVELPKLSAEHGVLTPFTVEQRLQFSNISDPAFFTRSERDVLGHFVIKHMAFRSSDQVDALFGACADVERREALRERVQAGAPILASLAEAGLTEEPVPIHDDGKRREMMRRWFFSLSPPEEEVAAYFGSEVAFYFAWLSHFTRWLLVPGALGLALFLWRRLWSGTSVDNSAVVPIFSLTVVLWSFLHDKFWTRHSNELAYRVGTFDDEDRPDSVREGFRGEMHTSEVTGRLEPRFPAWKRRLRYLVSAAVTGPMLAVAFAFMVCSLNLQGYIHRPDSAFHIPALHQFSLPGRVFDPNGPPYLALLPTVVHAVAIMSMNSVYRAVAERLTEHENHKTAEAHRNALILKRFLFEAFDAYIALFYLAFYERDIMLLRAELVSLFTTDSIRRVGTEAVLPLVTQWFAGRSAAGKRAVADLARDDYEQFDDFLEMVIEMGYVTLFAGAMPLAAAVAIVCNHIEIRSDLFKLLFVSRKPWPERVRSIGTWHAVQRTMAWVSVLTNVLLFGLASDQMVVWFPALFHRDNIAVPTFGEGMEVEAEQVAVLGRGRLVVALLWLIEHLVLLACAAIVTAIPSVPGRVRKEQARRSFVANKERREACLEALGRAIAGSG